MPGTTRCDVRGEDILKNRPRAQVAAIASAIVENVVGDSG